MPITAADSAQRTTDRVAGPKESISARPITGLSAKQAGTKARSSQFMGRGIRREAVYRRPAAVAQAYRGSTEESIPPASALAYSTDGCERGAG
jgi:hypothetical protein